ncbi:respiratory nitrate reductase subunit gamma [Aquibacillus koreensis]|uniref:Respiratory nitrate reductase subunit gamma n=1 Tax=Aquibacillus koreensis TaxID=279446 RepID=A0A9X3WJA5_9BACI|nr:respiratory nitrate reductase subunit gamma [Aquibacillus koreensis]MCT2535218.1 respiratory nitrate reductase subunit gamma [Aquibacillus koreensis]MDC3421077.1 respiratory nitrate reductase subunit gamma [Aquibacillus koreensis]
MNIIQLLIWVVLPLSSMAIFLMGLIWQYKSKESYQKGLKNMFCVGIGTITLITGLISLNGEVNVVHWMVELFSLHSTGKLMATTSLLFQIHILSLCGLLIILPFTQYIKLFNIIASVIFTGVMAVITFTKVSLVELTGRVVGIKHHIKTKPEAVKEF